MNQTYLDTARLLTQVAPLVFVDDTFALKGGTAINLFVRDLPRLSVDLDLVFLPLKPREEALAEIAEGLKQIAAAVKRLIPGIQVFEIRDKAGQLIKLNVRGSGAQIKVE